MARRIPTAAARRIAEEYGYDQVIIIARKVDSSPDAGDGEQWHTTYGVDPKHCRSADLQMRWLERMMAIYSDAEKRALHAALERGALEVLPAIHSGRTGPEDLL